MSELIRFLEKMNFDDWMGIIGGGLLTVGAICLASVMVILTVALFGAVFFGWGG